MIVTYSWLKEFVNCDLKPEELAHRLTMAGLEVDAMDMLGEGLDSVVVARLLSVEPHPDADRLTLCQVDAGSGEPVQVVCGATNHKSGDLVAFAQVGTVLPGDFKIKKSKIRGQVSFGMLCSEKELGLAEEAEGIMILPPDLALGTALFDALDLKDVRFELGLTPNRADCLSVIGVAREVAAICGKPLRVPEFPVEEEGEPISERTSVTIEEPGMCPRYAARLIRGVRIGPSPGWLVRRLESVGQRSINNVVDVTNFVLMELGHPLHAFDFRLLRGGRIVVRRAADNERFTTLDSQERFLNSGDLTICDADGPVALAGIMGGENSEIQDDTVDILLESAYFNPPTIRRTSKRLGIHSESSHRFERGADVDMVPMALDRAAELIRETAGGVISTGVIDVYPAPIERKRLRIHTDKTDRLLGVRIETLEIKRLLETIGFACHLEDGSPEGVIHVDVPNSRPDIEREVDLIEEVARLNGYDAIPTTMPAGRVVCHPEQPLRRIEQSLRDAMVSCGYSEVINYAFHAPGALDKIRLSQKDERRNQVCLLNPLTEDQSVMRTSLVPGVLQNVTQNLARRSAGDLRLFELRPVFLHEQEGELPREVPHLVFTLSGRREPLGWAQSNDPVDFFDLKAVVEELVARLRLGDVQYDPAEQEPFLHPGKSCAVTSNQVVLGMLGEVHPQVLKEFEIEQPVFLCDLDLAAIAGVSGNPVIFKGLSRFPGVDRDSALLVDEEVSARRILEAARSAKARDVEDVVLFDLYRGKGIPEGKKSIAIRVRYRRDDKTLTDEEVSKAHGRIIKALENELGAEIR